MTFDGGVGGGDDDDSDRFRWWLLCLYFFCCGCIFLAFDCSGFVPFDICGYNFFFFSIGLIVGKVIVLIVGGKREEKRVE